MSLKLESHGIFHQEIALIFDLDGTLLDSVPDLADAANKVLTSVSRGPMDLAEIQSFVGNGIPDLVRRIMEVRNLPPGIHQELTALFLEYYNAAPIRLSKPFPGVDEELDRLVSAGASLGLCTNKPEVPTRAILRHLGWDAMIGTVVAGDTLTERKPDPRPLLHAADLMNRSRTIFVGDSEVDSATAQAAGMPLLLFEGGYRKVPIKDMYHSASFQSFSQIEAALIAVLNQERP